MTEALASAVVEFREPAQRRQWFHIESFYNRHRLHPTLDYVTPIEQLQLMAAAKVA